MFPANIHWQQTSLPLDLPCIVYAPIYAPHSFLLLLLPLSLIIFTRSRSVDVVCAIRMYHVIYRIQCDLINVLMTNLFEWIYVSRASIHSLARLALLLLLFGIFGLLFWVGFNPREGIEKSRTTERKSAQIMIPWCLLQWEYNFHQKNASWSFSMSLISKTKKQLFRHIGTIGVIVFLQHINSIKRFSFAILLQRNALKENRF